MGDYPMSKNQKDIDCIYFILQVSIEFYSLLKRFRIKHSKSLKKLSQLLRFCIIIMNLVMKSTVN